MEAAQQMTTQAHTLKATNICHFTADVEMFSITAITIKSFYRIVA